MYTSKLTKQEIIDKIVNEYETLSRYARNTDDSGFKEFEQERAAYLKTLMGILEITEEEA